MTRSSNQSNNQTQIIEHLISHPLFVHWSDGLLVLDTQQKLLAINPVAEQLLGYHSDELTGQPIHTALCGYAADYQHAEENCLFAHLKENFSLHQIKEAWLIKKAGGYLHVDIRCMAPPFSSEHYSVLSFQDCSLRRYSEKELQRLASFAELSPSPILQFNEQALIYYSNPAMVQLIAELGFNANGMPKILPSDIKAIISRCLSSQITISHIEVESGGRWFIWNFHAVREHNLVQAYGLDITARKESESLLFAEKERFLVTLEAIDDAVISVDKKECITYINPKATELTGWKNIEAVGKTFKQVVTLYNMDPGSTSRNWLRHAIDANATLRSTESMFLAHREGYVIEVEKIVSPMRSEHHDVMGAVIVLHDISQAKKMEQSLTWQMTHDRLTGLINRTEFESRLRLAIERSHTDKIVHALIYLDLDNFKIVNDTSGHVAGDQLLRHITKILMQKLRRGDILARLGGDEFGAILEGCPIERAATIAKEICHEIQEYVFIWEAHSFNVGASIGLVPIDESSNDIDQLLSLADSSCYAAKDMGRNRVHVFQEDDVDVMKKKGEMQWVSKINKALHEERFLLYFQLIKPIHCEENGLHFEILLRMQDEHGNIIPPGAFLPAAEHYDIIKILDHWVVRQTFNWLNAHPDVTKNVELCSINLSGNSIGDEHFMHHLKEHFRHCQFPADIICFEVTETAAISNLSVASLFIDTIKELGCSFSLDDFGSGMSSFGYLKQLNIDYLKIDGLFVKDIVIDPVDAAMVKSINEVGQMMGLKTIAEYVENDNIMAVLAQIGVDFGQGYGIACPKPISELLELVKLKDNS